MPEINTLAGEKICYKYLKCGDTVQSAPQNAANYITKHLGAFDGGATRFMLKSSLEKRGPAQIDGMAFVLPKFEADQLLKNIGGDAGKMEDFLGLPRGGLSGKELVRLDFEDPKSLKLRLPSGNEAGANPQWIPGGRLPEGGIEAVINIDKNAAPTWVESKVKF